MKPEQKPDFLKEKIEKFHEVAERIRIIYNPPRGTVYDRDPGGNRSHRPARCIPDRIHIPRDDKGCIKFLWRCTTETASGAEHPAQ